MKHKFEIGDKVLVSGTIDRYGDISGRPCVRFRSNSELYLDESDIVGLATPAVPERKFRRGDRIRILTILGKTTGTFRKYTTFANEEICVVSQDDGSRGSSKHGYGLFYERSLEHLNPADDPQRK